LVLDFGYVIFYFDLLLALKFNLFWFTICISFRIWIL